jgi:type III pantothenate kinase
MLLVIDIGNTNIVVGVYERDTLLKSWRISTQRERTVDEHGILMRQFFLTTGLDPEQVKAVAISSVVPPLTGVLEETSRRYFHRDPLVVEPSLHAGMPILCDNPREVGADRIVNAVAAYEFFGGPLIIVDFGTATTFCAVSARGEYLGGLIAPGISISAEALFQKTAKLPKVGIRKPERVIGRNTVSSMESGIFYGYVSLVDGIIKRMKKELHPNPTVLATGGLAHLIGDDSREIQKVLPNLTLEGLRIIFEKNCDKRF